MEGKQQQRLHDGSSSRPVVRGVVFDMDGTLSVPAIAFSEMRRRLDIPDGDLLEVLDSWPEEKQAWGNKVLEEIEGDALKNLKLLPGVLELAAYLDEMHIPRALITRNNAKSVIAMHERFFPDNNFAPALDRSFRPYKPNPAAIQHICKLWHMQPSEVVMIGDSPHDDVVSGSRAGSITILLDTDKRFHGPDSPPHKDWLDEQEHQPTYIAASMAEVQQILSEKVALTPK
ncbi:hypothetical protein WJX73_002941 [Symbiochloris irregularis]|uniref:Uncharacterized protein n=1 Tax=Symbiochloris irregularis TaxID=706552 RepID=A0AAW1NV13_9CHLO